MVLLIALIILVAMTLAGIGMMRSVDTGSLIAGNLAFKQATLNASDASTSAAFNALASVANSGPVNKTILELNAGAACPVGATAAGCPGATINFPGYFPTPINHPTNGICEVRNLCTQQSETNWWSIDANWNNAPTVTVTDPTNNATIATVSYLIHRMCEASGSPTAAGQLCQTFTQPATGCSKTQILPCTSTSIFYRITTRSVGKRNTVTYAQSLVLIAQ
jgi:Tfp pilus assembly protein PilX